MREGDGAEQNAPTSHHPALPPSTMCSKPRPRPLKGRRRLGAMEAKRRWPEGPGSGGNKHCARVLPRARPFNPRLSAFEYRRALWEVTLTVKLSVPGQPYKCDQHQPES